MHDAAFSDRRASVRALQEAPDASREESIEVAVLLSRAGIDHASSLWFQLLELATQAACDWIERSADCGAQLSVRAAAVLGLRSLAADLLSSALDEEENARAIAEACLAVCTEPDAADQPLPPRRRRWGEGAVPQPPQRPGLLQGDAGCC